MGVDINSYNDKDDNDSVSSSSLSSASTITTPVSPNREHKGSVKNTEEDINGHSQFQGFSRLRLNTNLQNDHFLDSENIVFDSRKKKSKKHFRMNSLQNERENIDGSPSQQQGFCESPRTDANEQELQDTEACDGNQLSIYCVRL